MKRMLDIPHRPLAGPDLFARLLSYFAEKPEVWAAYVFGSTALGSAGPTSHVDVAVLREPLADRRAVLDARADYAADLAMRLGRAVDVVLFQEADDILSEAILREGVVVYEGDIARHRSFQASRLLRCLDFQPTRALAQRGLAEAIRRAARGS